ncbi:CopL family metal-binding regulatory protein [Luteimonas sp. FCS-9]|uniref:CopL family metal-binding regulatory protein n=1 Tax=Luteimonas sp. FCS-9 TaxID=1547516 RepID=UPI00069979F0|nr:CopL family metal-binding regulatory protein [Luteimonas sp. FCS-9]
MPRVLATAVRVLLIALLVLDLAGTAIAATPVMAASHAHHAGDAAGADVPPCHDAGDVATAADHDAGAGHHTDCCGDGGCLCLHGCSTGLIPDRPLPTGLRPMHHDGTVLHARAGPWPVQPIRPPIAAS